MRLLLSLAAAAAAAGSALPPPSAAAAAVSYGAVLSAGFTSDMVLARAPARAAVYGLVFGVGSNVPRVTVTVDGGAPIEAVVEPGLQGASPSANACDRSCFDAGHLSVGAISCCNQPSCAMGCIFAARFPSEAACSAQCARARNASSCTYTAPGTSWPMDMCEACPPSGCPAAAECEAGCAAFFAPPQAPLGWKALLPPMPAGGASTIVVACASGCAAGAQDPAPLERVAWGEVVYCSGQSNMALGVQYSYLFDNLTAAILKDNAYSNIRFFQFGGMGYQNDADAEVYATTAMAPSIWPWQNLSTAVRVNNNTGVGAIQAFGSLSATCFYFAKSLTDAWGAGSAPPIGLITNAVGGTTIASWSDPADLAQCTNATDTASAAPPFVLFNGMAAPFFNTTITAIAWLQGENDCGGTPGNSLTSVGYGCALPKMIAKYRARWSATPGTTDPLVPFGVVTLAAGTSEGSTRNMAGMRWSQSCNFGVMPNEACPNTFIAQAFDISDPWQTYDCDGQHCSLVDPATGKYGPQCADPWTDLSRWDAVMLPLAPLVRKDSTPSFMGGIHPRLKPPVGERLAQAFLNGIRGDGSKPFTGPTIAGCTASLSDNSIAVAYDAALLRGERVAVSSFNTNMSTWGARDSLTFMACFSALAGADCLAGGAEALWVPAAAAEGDDGATVLLTVPAPPAAGGVLSALRYAWPLFDDGDTCCPDLASTRGHAACIPANCPIKLAKTLLPGNPFYARITPAGKCACLAPQTCDA